MKKDYKYFNGYLYGDYKTKPLHIMLPKMNAYVKTYDSQAERMYFLTEGDNLLKKWNTICDKVNANVKKQFDGEPVYNKKFSKIKIKPYADEATDFYNKEIPRVGSNRPCLVAINLGSAIKKDENYYL